MDERAMLTELVATRDARCPACGYNLRGAEFGGPDAAAPPACPECGEALGVGVRGGTSVTFGWWRWAVLAGVASMFLLTGALAVSSAAFLWRSSPGAAPVPQAFQRVYWTNTVIASVSAVLALAALVRLGWAHMAGGGATARSGAWRFACVVLGAGYVLIGVAAGGYLRW